MDCRHVLVMKCLVVDLRVMAASLLHVYAVAVSSSTTCGLGEFPLLLISSAIMEPAWFALRVNGLLRNTFLLTKCIADSVQGEI